MILALDRRFGEPVDAYVNGSQVWLRPDGPGGVTIEWRLHPGANYQRPAGVATAEVFERVAYALQVGEMPPAPLDRLWDGLEAYPAYGDEVEPAPLSGAATHALGLAPDAAGLIDHGPIGDAWERSRGGISIIDEVLRQLEP
ncbi:MAG: hypothetical protein ACRDZ8_12540 [Acidimicrobiales bacterium]